MDADGLREMRQWVRAYLERDEEIVVPLLAEKTKRAFYLIGFCRAKLSQTESEVKAVLQKIEEGPDTAADATTGHDLDL